MRAAVLMQPAPDPEPRRDHPAGHGLGPVPLGEPDVVGLGVAGPLPGHEVGDHRVGVAVHARPVAVGVELGGPAGQEREHRRGVGRRQVVVLHVVVDRVPGAEAEPAGVGGRVVGGGDPLHGRLPCGDPATATAVRRCLEPDVGRNQVPSRRGLAGNPRRSQIRLRARHVRPADVDADRAVGRGAPRAHVRRAGGRAGVEPAAREHGRDRGHGCGEGAEGRAGPGSPPKMSRCISGRLVVVWRIMVRSEYNRTPGHSVPPSSADSFCLAPMVSPSVSRRDVACTAPGKAARLRLLYGRSRASCRACLGTRGAVA